MQLRDAVLVALSDRPTRRSIQLLVTTGQKLAHAYLAKRRRSGSFRPEFFGLPIEDLAFDCVADLFERDGRGNFPKLRRYFCRMSVSDLTEAEVLAAYRKLVFGRITQRLFEQYRDEDPQLGRLIRNIKHAVGLDPDLLIERRSGTLYITSRNGDRDREPLMPPELLQYHLLRRLNGSTSLSSVLTALASTFSSEPSYRPCVHVSAFAQTVRSILMLLAEHPANESETPLLDPHELELIVSTSVRAVSRKMQRTYLEKGKVDHQTYRSYFLAIRDILSAQFVRDDPSRSYHDILARYILGLSNEAYARDHRCYLEYLTRLSREAMIAQVAREV